MDGATVRRSSIFQWVWMVILADTFLMVQRLVQRFVSVVRISGWFQAFLSIPRAVVGNAINFCATAMATAQFFRAERTGKRVEWKKTAHVFPSIEQLQQHRRRLGDMLLENRLINLVQLRTALLAQTREGIKLGEVLTQLGYVSEEDLLAVLSRQLNVPSCGIDVRTIDLAWLRRIPAGNRGSMDGSASSRIERHTRSRLRRFGRSGFENKA